MYTNEVSVPAFERRFQKTFSGRQLKSIHDVHGQNEFNVHLLITSWVTLLADSPLVPTYYHDVNTFNRFFNRLCDELFDVIGWLDDLADELSRSIVHGDEAITTNHFIAAMLDTPISKEYLVWYKNPHANSVVLQYMLSFLSFGSKLFYEDRRLDSTALRGWIDVEDKLAGLKLHSTSVELLAKIIASFFTEWRPAAFLPKHGNGAVAERGVKGTNSKNGSFALHPRIDRLLNWTGSYSGCDVSHFLPEMGCDTSTESRETSRLKFVPKNYKKTRSICMEPTAFMWAQQGVRLWYEDHIRSVPLLRDSVTIHDQTNNQDGARFGSVYGQVDTIDLSAASDSVSWDLVKRIFPPGVSKYLAATRTSWVELPNGRVRKVYKFAPMGSALCFPVQSTVYSAIVILASLQHAFGLSWLAENLRKDNVTSLYRSIAFRDFTFETNKLQPFRVYGDDIICDTRVTPIVVNVLRRLGFQVNNEKSFVRQQAYRESCGKHYCDGVDVTPFYFRVKKIGKKIRIDSLGGVIDAANRAKSYGFLNLRTHLIRFINFYPILNVRVRSGERNPILFTEDENQSFAVLCDSADNSHLKKREFDISDVIFGSDRYHAALERRDTRILYQRDEVQSITVAIDEKVDVDEKFDNYHFIVWQRSRYHQGKTPDESSGFGGIDARGTRVRRRWTPA